MNILLETLLTVMLTIIAVQSIKLATDGIKGNFNLRSIFSVYGGMPSSHSATVASLSTMVAYLQGINTIEFAITVIFSMIVIIDAMMFRAYVDRNSRSLQKLIDKLSDEEKKEFKPIAVKLRHTFPQVLVGVIIGVGIASLVHLLAK